MGKRHGSQDRLLQLTRCNYRQIIEQQERCSTLGVRLLDPKRL